jgi:hypothetical protein
MAGSQIATSVTILNSLHGFQALSLTEYTTSAASAIAAGSVVEIAGAFFTFPSDEAINASSWTAITTATTAYIQLTPSGTAGSQIVSASYTSTASVWRDDMQGWYASVGSNIRVVGSVYKAGTTSYGPKYLYNPKVPDSYRQSGKQVFTTSGVFHVPLTVNQVYLTGCAAGGDGGLGHDDNIYGGGGGGAGEIVYKKAFSVTPGTSIIVTIGAVGYDTSFGAVAFNYGKGGAAGTSSGTGGAGGALGNGTVAGATGGNSSIGDYEVATTMENGFAGMGTGGVHYNTYYSGGGGAGGLGNFVAYSANSNGETRTTAGGIKGAHGGGGGGGGCGSSTAGGVGGNGGYGSGGGGGGANSGSGIGGAGGSGGPGLIIVEW